jgi:DNA-binding transcriptional LysR family regulator
MNRTCWLMRSRIGIVAQRAFPGGPGGGALQDLLEVAEQGEVGAGGQEVLDHAGVLAAGAIQLVGGFLGIAVNWVLEGHGILLRAEWDVERYLASGRLVQVLQGWESPDADIHAVYAQQHRSSVRVKALVDFVAAAFDAQRNSRQAQAARE